MNTEKAAALFRGWDEALIWSCLDGSMGTLTANDSENPTSALIDNGDFCFLAGKATACLLSSITGDKLLIPQDAAWQALIERFFGERVRKTERYAIKKEANIFNRAKLTAYANSLREGFSLTLFDQRAYEMAKGAPWSFDLCSQFAAYGEYEKRALGVAAWHGGALVAGASSYVVYCGGIETEIDTKPDYRQKGLATACGARLILECLDRGLYPSWDAHDLRSVALAEKLGYHLDQPYVTYELSGD